MKVLLTGASGFLGRIIYAKLMDHEVDTMGRGASNKISFDLSIAVPYLSKSYDQIIHCAGKAHEIPKGKEEKEMFFKVNHLGTINLLKAITPNLPRRLVLISTVAVYGRETGIDISERHPLEGSTPYALSKIKAEREVTEWGKKFNIPILILRLPLIAGPNPPGNLGKMIRGIQKGRYLSIGGGKALRSVVLADDVANLIAEHPLAEGVYNLTDGYHPTFREMEIAIAKQLEVKRPISIPKFWAKVLGELGEVIPGSPINNLTINKMLADLTFEDHKARHELNWNPKKVISNFMIN